MIRKFRRQARRRPLIAGTLDEAMNFGWSVANADAIAPGPQYVVDIDPLPRQPDERHLRPRLEAGRRLPEAVGLQSS